MEKNVEYYPLTHPQKSIWYTEKMYPGTSIGNVAATLRIKGNVDYSLLEKAVNILIEKNDGLRLRIVEIDGEVKQYVSKYKYQKFDFYDFSEKNIEELYEWDEKQSKIPFKLEDSSLYNFVLIKISDEEAGIFGNLHHIISDAWTMSLAGNQVVEYYTLLKNSSEISEQNKPSYLEYIKSEEEYLKSNRFQKDMEFWNNKFNCTPESTTLKTKSINHISLKSRRKTALIPKKLSIKIKEYCLKNKVSEYTLFLSALAMYVNRVTGKEEIVLGTTTLNRSNTREKESIGTFFNAIPVKININNDIDFNTFATKLSKETISLFRHQKYPYNLLIKDIRNQFNFVNNLIDIFLNYQNSKFNAEENKEKYSTRWHFRGYQNESLIIHINDREDEGQLIIDYDYLIDLFHATEIEFIHQHIVNLLWHALDNPTKQISKLNMLSEKEQHRILYEFNETKIECKNNLKLQELINEQTNIIQNNSKSYILDKNLNLLPIGIAGQLYISDENIINQDLQNAGLTQETLIENPYIEGKKLIRTNYIVRWYPNGGIEYLGKKENEENLQKEKVLIKIAATFTSEPIEGYIKWWTNKFGYESKIEFAGYNQVFQELLNHNSMLSENTDGINVVLVRFEDYIRNANNRDKEKMQMLDKVFDELKSAISNFSNNAPLIMPIFPVSTHLNLSSAVENKIEELNNKFEGFISQNKSIYALKLNNIQGLYSIDLVFDKIKDKEGHMPFTEEYYAAIGTEIARKICAIKKQCFKVIVLDCDETLWKGICGEQGTLGVKIEGAYRKLQEFMLQRYNEGMLLAVCSKNNENDVLDVFDNNPNMMLNKKHIVNFKINWNEKSQNIKEIAKELNLGLDSFIFIDDSLIECSKMVESCPEVLTLLLPEKEELIPLFLNHVWAFDRVKITKEDTMRNSMYEAEQKRKEIQEQELTLDQFTKNLELKVSMREIVDEEVNRASQMTQRTNQFNLSTIRRSEQEIRALMNDDKVKVFIIEVTDKFGDYGIVGLVIINEKAGSLFIDTFLLSCRVLGREIEYIVLAGIRRYAKNKAIRKIKACFVPTEKNKPIQEFIESTKWNKAETVKNNIMYNISIDDLPKEIDHISFYYNEMYEKRNEKIQISVDEEIVALDHIGVAVKNMIDADEYYKLLGYKCSNTVHDVLQNSYLSIYDSEKFLPIELVAPVNEESPSYNMIEAYGEHPYHLCFRVSNIKNFLENIKDIEYEIVSDEKPAALFNNQKVAFIIIKNVGLIELVETGIKNINKGRNKKFNNNTIKLVVSDLNKALAFYKKLGYICVKNIKDIINGLIMAELIGYYGEKIELITPLKEDTEEYKFLKHNGVGIYQIHFGFSKIDKLNFDREFDKFINMYRNYNKFYQAEENIIASNDYDLCDTKILQKLKHKEYLLPIENFNGRRLIQLPIFEEVNYVMNAYVAPRNEIEEKLATVCEQILKIKKVGIDDDFFEIGGDSLNAIQLQVNLLECNWNLTTQDIYNCRTIRQLSNVIMNENKNIGEINRTEKIAKKDVKTKITCISKKNMEYSNILLIGATGYLGPHIFNELLARTKSNIYCLVRSKTNNDGKERLQETLKFYFGDKYNLASNNRVFVVSGDITLEHLGMEQNEYIQLQNKIDAVIHTGALVSYYGEYSKFEEINVNGTERVIKFCQKDNKPLIYTSTMSVSGQYLVTNKNDNKVNVFTEDDLYIGQNYYNNPYVRSKYETEILVNKYIKSGAKIAVLRVGNLTGRFIDGHFQKNIAQNEFYNIMKSIFSIGAVSKNVLNEYIDFTPVDYISKAVVSLLMKSESIGQTFHLYNPNLISVSQLIELFNVVGIKVKCLEKDEFRQLIENILSDELKKDYLGAIINHLDKDSQLGFNTSVKLDSEITVSYLKQLGFEWPKITTEYIQKIVDYMKQVKYIS